MLWDSVVAETVRAANDIIEARVREAMTLAGVTEEDLQSGRARGERRAYAGCECQGSGIRTRMMATKITVELCPCLEVIITTTAP